MIIFASKTLFPKFLYQVWFTSFNMDYMDNNESYYGECVGHLAVRSAEHIGISFLTNGRVQSRKDSAACHHLLNCNYSDTFEDFSVLCHKNRIICIRLNEFLSHCLLPCLDL